MQRSLVGSEMCIRDRNNITKSKFKRNDAGTFTRSQNEGDILSGCWNIHDSFTLEFGHVTHPGGYWGDAQSSPPGRTAKDTGVCRQLGQGIGIQSCRLDCKDVHSQSNFCNDWGLILKSKTFSNPSTRRQLCSWHTLWLRDESRLSRGRVLILDQVIC